MHWLLKAAGMKVLSVAPGGDAIYHCVQRRVTRSILPTREAVAQRVQVGFDYLSTLSCWIEDRQLRASVHLDIGAGWVPTIPFLFYGLGIERQILCDIRPNMTLSAVLGTARLVNSIAAESAPPNGFCWRRSVPAPDAGETLRQYFGRLGICYRAPYCSDDLLLEQGFTLATCTQVLQYVRRPELSSLLQGIRRALSIRGGLLIASVHLYDPRRYSDPLVVRYDKWRYSESAWSRLVECKLESFNRLTPSEYWKLLAASGFEVLDYRVAWPTPQDLEELRRVPVHSEWSDRDEMELGATELCFVARAGH